MSELLASPYSTGTPSVAELVDPDGIRLHDQPRNAEATERLRDVPADAAASDDDDVLADVGIRIGQAGAGARAGVDDVPPALGRFSQRSAGSTSRTTNGLIVMERIAPARISEYCD